MKLFELYDYETNRTHSWHATLEAAVKAQARARSKVAPSVKEEVMILQGESRIIQTTVSPDTLIIVDVLGRNIRDCKHPLHKAAKVIYKGLGLPFDPNRYDNLFTHAPTGKYNLVQIYPRLKGRSQHLSVEAAAREAANWCKLARGSLRHKYVCFDPKGVLIDYTHKEYATYSKAFADVFQKTRKV